MRYQCQVLPGLLILFGPILHYFINLPKGSLLRSLGSGILLFWILIQGLVIEKFMYFQQHGDEDRLYIYAANQAIGADGQLKIEKPALLPVHVPEITPGRGMPDLVRSYHWLSGE